MVQAQAVSAQGRAAAPAAARRAARFVIADLRNARWRGQAARLTMPSWRGRRVGRPRGAVGRAAARRTARPGARRLLPGCSTECPSRGARWRSGLTVRRSPAAAPCGGRRRRRRRRSGVSRERGHGAVIPLGTVGTLALARSQPLPRQVVAFSTAWAWRRPATTRAFWLGEYLLYHPTEAFRFPGRHRRRAGAWCRPPRRAAVVQRSTARPRHQGTS